MKMPVADNTYDAVYTIEASCHAPDPVSIPSTFMPTYTLTILNFRSTFADECLCTLTVFCFLWTANLQVACYTEIKRVLKPGQLFAGYEWCITDAYNPDNKDHKRVKVITSSI
jgi:sterol 24-C-methyltransferase